MAFRNWLKIFGAFHALLIISSCGGSGPTSPNNNMTFTGTSSPGDNTVYMSKNDALSSGDVIAIDLRLNSFSSYVYGGSLNVNFDSKKMNYVGYSTGSFLEQDGKKVNYMSAEDPDKVVLGISRLGPAGGVSGSGTLVILKFKAVEAGTSTISFIECNLKDPTLNTISVAGLYGGTVTVQ